MSLSNILYLRGLGPERLFYKRYVTGGGGATWVWLFDSDKVVRGHPPIEINPTAMTYLS
jgi:hypothetical protein